jgi:ABC-type multidrug transport system ATPase subunit
MTRGIGVDVEGVSQRVRGQQILRDVSLRISPGELAAIVGVSGAGKTMLLETLAGWRAPDEGTIRYESAAGHASLDALRPSLGYVPQDDIIHSELSLERTLRYAARLRLPAGTRKEQVDKAVRGVLQVLGLAGRAGIKVGSLSGGERKRASIGVELLTAPRLFFLDEPTSGLDPATAAGFMRLLRRLADLGTTVVLTTHGVGDLDACDKVIFLSREGSVAFAGSAGQAREHFGTARLEEAYLQLDTENLDGWPARFTTSTGQATGPGPAAGPAHDMASGVPAAADELVEHGASEGGTAPAADVLTANRRPGAIGQWALLTRRAIEIQQHSKLTLAILLGSPAMVLLMFVVLFRPHAFSPAHPSPNGTLMTGFWIAFAGFFFGLSYGLPQICAEFPIVRREHHVGVGIGPYVLSKLAVLTPLLAVVDAATLGVLRVLGRLPASGAAQAGSLFLTLLLASVAALALGLLTSAAVTGPSQAIVAMPMLCFPQVLFCGAFIPVPAMAAAGRLISYAMSNRWAFEAFGHVAGLPQLWADGGSPLGPPLLASYGGTFSHPAWADWVILSGFTLLFLVAARIVLGLRCSVQPVRSLRHGPYQSAAAQARRTLAADPARDPAARVGNPMLPPQIPAAQPAAQALRPTRQGTL